MHYHILLHTGVQWNRIENEMDLVKGACDVHATFIGESSFKASNNAGGETSDSACGKTGHASSSSSGSNGSSSGSIRSVASCPATFLELHTRVAGLAQRLCGAHSRLADLVRLVVATFQNNTSNTHL